MAKHTITTNLSVGESRPLLERAFEEYGRKFAEYQPNLTWRPDAINTAAFSFLAKGHKIEGQMIVLDKKIEVQIGKLPGLMFMLEGVAVKTVQSEVLKQVEVYQIQKARQRP